MNILILISVIMFYETFLYLAISSLLVCYGKNSEHICEFQNINGDFEDASFPFKLTRVIKCCDTKKCGGYEVQVLETRLNVKKMGSDWFINRTITNDTVYMIKRKHSRVFRTPVGKQIMNLLKGTCRQ